MGDILKDLGNVGEIGVVVGDILSDLGFESVGGTIGDIAGGLASLGNNVTASSGGVAPGGAVAAQVTPSPVTPGAMFGTAGGLGGSPPTGIAGLPGGVLPGVAGGVGGGLGLVPTGSAGGAAVAPDLTPAVVNQTMSMEKKRPRRMNPGNTKATNRAIRRLTGAKKFADSIYCALDGLGCSKPAPKRRAPARRTRKAACKC